MNYLVASHFAGGGKVDSLYAVVEQPLKVVQTVALLEILHSALGIVRSPVFTTVLQGASTGRPVCGRSGQPSSRLAGTGNLCAAGAQRPRIRAF